MHNLNILTLIIIWECWWLVLVRKLNAFIKQSCRLNQRIQTLTIAVSVNKADVAIPLFRTALETNPKIEQFWLNYIYALIKEKKFDNAKAVLEQGKNQGVSGEKVGRLRGASFS